MQVVYVLPWTESERGWGVRPGGVSIHFSREAVEQYVKDHEKWQLKTYGANAPDEYSFADPNHAYPAKLVGEHCDEKILKHVLAEESFRDWRNSPPYIEKL